MHRSTQKPRAGPTCEADELPQVAGHEVAQLGQVGHVDEADEELALQPLRRQDERLGVRAHKLLHRLRASDRAC